MWNVKRIVILAVALSALAAFYFLAGDRRSRIAREKREAARVLPLTGGSAVQFLSLEQKATDAITLTKIGDAWRVKKPVTYPAEDFVAEGLVTALTTTTWEDSFPVAGADLQEMGLSDPAVKIGVGFDPAPSEVRTLLLGNPVPTGGFVYARWQDEEKIFLVHNQFARSFEKTLYTVRKKRVFDLGWEGVQGVEVTLPGREWTLAKWQGQWYVSQAGEARTADTGRVESLVSDLTNIYVREFLDDVNAGNPDLGLQPRKHGIALSDASGVSFILWVGVENKEKESYYALKQGETTALLIPAAKIGDLPQSGSFFEVPEQKKEGEKAEKLVETAPPTSVPAVPPPLSSGSVQANPGAVQALSMKKLGTEVKLVRMNDAWQFDGALAIPGKDLGATVTSLVHYLKGLSLGELLGEDKRPVIPYAISVRILNSDQKEEQYTFYRSSRGIFAELSGRPGVYQLDEQVWRDMDGYLREFLSSRRI
jgi:hypothetical protein